MSTELVERLRAVEAALPDRPYAALTARKAADELTALTAKVALLTEALEYIARGYSGSLEGGHAESHSGTYCAEVAHRALSEPDKEGT